MLVRGSIILEDSLVTGKSPRVQADDHHTFSHTSTADHGDQARFAGRRSEGIVHYTTWTFTIDRSSIAIEIAVLIVKLS